MCISVIHWNLCLELVSVIVLLQRDAEGACCTQSYQMFQLNFNFLFLHGLLYVSPLPGGGVLSVFAKLYRSFFLQSLGDIMKAVLKLCFSASSSECPPPERVTTPDWSTLWSW